jgi:hypothetical protein
MVNFDLLQWLEPYCKKLYITDSQIVDELINRLEFEAHYFSNLRWKYPNEYWQSVKELFNPTDFSTRVLHADIDSKPEEDIIISFKYSELKESFNEELRSVIENIHAVVDQNEEGILRYGPFTFDIKKKNNIMQTYKKQLTTDKLISSQKFIFV